MRHIVKLLAIAIVLSWMVGFSTAQVEAGQAVVSWDPPTTNEDGTPITNLTGFKVYWGTANGGPYPNVKDVPGATVKTTTVTGLEPGTYFFVATAYNSYGKESKYSNQVAKTVEAPIPSPPANCR